MAAKRPKGARSRAKCDMPDATVADTADLRLLARDAALAALKRLADLSRSDDERIALAATQELLNRAFGRASTAGSDEAPAAQPLVIRIVKFGDASITKEGEQS